MSCRKFFLQLYTILVLATGLLAQESFSEPPVLFPNPLSPRIANYDIDVVLSTADRELQARQVLTWTNKTDISVSDLQFHLYLNAFRNTESTFMLESGGQHRGNQIDSEGWGYINVTKLTLLNAAGADNGYFRLPQIDREQSLPGRDLTASMRFIHPDNPEHVDDKTVVQVDLPETINPGETVSVYFEFTAVLPSPPFARTGAKEEFFFVAQWFPKIGVYTNSGWNCHQFHRNSEFFADYGVYNVWITVPQENIVGATGIQVGEPLVNEDGSATHFYHAEDVHDFAWTTSPEFQVVTGKAQDVDIRVLLQPDHADQAARHVEAAKTSIEYFQDWYGDYPFPNLTVVDPRRGAGGAGGMEYPTLITAGTVYGLPETIRSLELVIIHEFGHNYWYHLLASNEFEESWLDEGINTYTEIQIMNDKYGPRGDAVDFMGLQLNDVEFQRASYLSSPDTDPMLRNSWEYYSGRSYGVNSYSRPGIVLTTLDNYLGENTMREILRTYVERFRFKHPTSEDFVNVASEVSGQDLSWFFNQVLHSNAILDYSVDRISSVPHREPRGIDFEKTHTEVPEDSAGIDTASASDTDETTYLSSVKLRRLGEFKMPVVLEVSFEDGTVITEHWDGQDLWKKYTYTNNSRLVSAAIDPQYKLVMDVNLTNNSKMLDPPSIGLNKVSNRWLFWMQFLIDQPAPLINLITTFATF